MLRIRNLSIHRTHNVFCCAVLLSAIAFSCAVISNRAMAISLECDKVDNELGMGNSLFYLRGSDENNCYTVPYNERSTINATVASAERQCGSSGETPCMKRGTEDIKANAYTTGVIKFASNAIASNGSVCMGVGDANDDVAHTGATINVSKLSREPGDCGHITDNYNACHAHDNPNNSPKLKKFWAPPATNVQIKEYLEKVRKNHKDWEERKKHYDECQSDWYKYEHETDDKGNVIFLKDKRGYRIETAYCRYAPTLKDLGSEPENEGDKELVGCGPTEFDFCMKRGYPDSYWFVDVDVRSNKPVARPGEIVTFTYSAWFSERDHRARQNQCGYWTEHKTTTGDTNVIIDMITENNGGETHVQGVLPAGTPVGQRVTWYVSKRVNQADVGRNVYGTIVATPYSWKWKLGFNQGGSTQKNSHFTVHYNWDIQLKSERKVESPHWNEPKPYGTETVNAYPLDFVTFKHTGELKSYLKTIPDQISPDHKNLRDTHSDKLYTLTNKPIDFYDHNDVFLLDEHRVERSQRWAKQWPAGVLPGVAQPPIVEGYVKNFFQHMPVTQDNVNTTMCEHITARPGSFIGSMIHNDPLGGRIGDLEHRSNDACVHFPYHYVHENPPYGKVKPDCTFNGTCPDNKVPDDYNGGLKISVSKNVDHVLLGDGFEFSNVTTHNGGRTKSKPYQYESYIAIFRGDAVNANNQKGPLIYPGRDFSKNGSINCMPGLNGNPHKVDRGAIKYCYSLCIHVDYDETKSCVDARPSIPVGGSASSFYKSQYDKEMFDEAKEAQPGDKICYWAAISDWSAIDDVSANSTLVSNMECIDIAKQPQMKIIGGDTIANGNIAGAYYNPVNPINDDRGSWSQYGLFSNGNIRDFGTAGFSVAWEGNQFKGCTLAYSNRLGLSPGKCEVSDKSRLGKFGMYSDGDKGYAPKVPVVDPTKLNKYTDSEIDFGASGFKSGNKEVALSYEGAKDLNIHGKLPDGARVVVYVANGVQVNITGDVMPEHNEFKSLSDVPSLTVISSNDININDNVENIFGNYISSKGHIYTCADAKSDADKGESSKLGVTDKCNKHMLRVQGALVSADNIVFHRTYGSRNFDLATRSLPSEEIDYTPNTFLLPYYSSYKFGDNTTFVIRTANNILPRY